MCLLQRYITEKRNSLDQCFLTNFGPCPTSAFLNEMLTRSDWSTKNGLFQRDASRPFPFDRNTRVWETGNTLYAS